MVVDDTPANVRMLKARLAREGYEVIAAHDGEQALAVARKERPDLILLDIMMPKFDGIEVCRRLKGDPPSVHPHHHDYRLVRLEGRGGRTEAGGDDYLRSRWINRPFRRASSPCCA